VVVDDLTRRVSNQCWDILRRRSVKVLGGLWAPTHNLEKMQVVQIEAPGPYPL
jgi:hypothetical protein